MRGDSNPGGIRWSSIFRVKILDLDAARSTFLEVRRRDHFDDECLDELLKEVDYVPLAVTLMARLGQHESPAALLERWRKEHTRLLSRPQDNHQSMNVDISIKISIQSHRMASNPEAIRLLGVVSFLPVGVPRADLISICRRISDAYEASVTLREVGLAFYDATDSLRVLSPIRKYFLQIHEIQEELLQDVRSFYFTMTRKALHFSSGSQPDSRDGTATTMELTRSSLNIEAVITEALQLELDTGKKQHWQSVEAAINWTRFILTTNPRTTMIELGLEVARARTARGEIFHSNPSRPIGFIQNGPLEAEPTTVASKRGAGVIQEGIMDLNTLADGVLGRHAGEITGFLAIQFTSRTEGTFLDQEMAQNINSCALVPWERPKHFFFHELGDCLFSLGDVKRFKGDFASAKDLFLEAMENYGLIKSDLEVAKCLWSLGDIYIGTSELELAHKTLKQAAIAFDSLELNSWLAWCDLALGRIQHMRGDIHTAEETFFKARDAFRLENDSLGYGECLWSLGDIYLQRSEYGFARQHLEDALALFKSVDHRLWVADCLLHLGTTQRLMVDYDAAYGSITEAREIWEGLKDTRGVAFAQFSMAKLQRAMGKPDAGKEALQKAINSFETLNDIAVVVECYMDLADAHLATMQFAAAYDAITTASDISRTAGDGVWLARCALTRGRIERTEHRLDRSRESFIKAHEEFQKENAAMEVGECLWNLGDIYLMKSEYTISHKYLEGALKAFESIKNIPWIAECLVSLGNALRLMGMHAIARETLSRARRETEAISDRRGTSRALYALVHCGRVAGDYTFARDVLLDAKDALEAINDPRGVARCLWELADIYIKAYDYDAAREALDKSTTAFNNLKDRFWLMRCRLTDGRIQLMKSELDAAQETFLKAQHEMTFGSSGNDDSSESMDSETDAWGIGECLFNLGEIHLQKSEGEAAFHTLTRALEIFTSGNLGCVADCHFSLGHAQGMMGRFNAARDHFIKGRETFKAVHNIDGAERCTAALDSILQPDGKKTTKQELVFENKYSTDIKWFPGYRSVQKIIDYFLPGQEYLW